MTWHSRPTRPQQQARLARSPVRQICFSAAAEAHVHLKRLSTQWPLRKLEQICEDPEREGRLREILLHGVLASSDFSGMGGDREIMAQLECAMSIKRWPLKAEGRRFRHVRACDISPLPQRVLCHSAMRKDAFQSCVFADLLDRLPEATYDEVMALMPEKTDDMEVAIAKYTFIDSLIRERRHSICTESISSHCVVRDRECCLQKCALQMMQEIEAEESECADEPKRMPLVLNSAGTSCVGRSSVGLKRRHADPSEVAVSVRTGPQMQGFPSQRTRSFAAGKVNAKLIWLGPEDPQAIQDDFNNVFASTLELPWTCSS